MRKLLNSIYVLDEKTWLYLDGERETFRRPLANVEDICCFNYVGCSPALMGKCMDDGKAINFFSPNGEYKGSVRGKTKGNILLRLSYLILGIW